MKVNELKVIHRDRAFDLSWARGIKVKVDEFNFFQVAGIEKVQSRQCFF